MTYCFRACKPFALVLMLFVLPLTVGFTDTEFACEEAYAHVEDCCGHEQLLVSCKKSCNSEPDTTFAEADCLRRASCDELRAAGACTDFGAAVCQ